MIEQHPIPAGMRLHPLRARYLTASDIGAVAGVDPYKSRLRVFMEKRGEIESQPDNAAMKRGRWLENAAISAMREEHPELTIVQPNVFLCDPEIRLGCTPDAWIEQDGGRKVNLQIKSTNPKNYEAWNGKPPLSYELQVIAESMLIDAASSILAVLVVDAWDAFLKLFPVPRHAKAEARIRDIATAFWADVEAGQYPPPDYVRDAEPVRQLFPPRPEVPVIDLSENNRLAAELERRARHKRFIKAAEEQCTAIETKVIHLLAGAERGVLPGWRISHKLQPRAGYTVAPKEAVVLRIARERET